jgi:hypothetical protein
MNDRFEEFIRSHSQEFDVREPDAALWNRIRKDTEPRRAIRLRYYISRAAIILFLIGATLIGQRIWMKGHSSIAQKNNNVELNIPELQEAEMYYTGMINAKLEEVKPLLSNHPSLEIELKSDLSELDSIYASLKNDLKDDIANQEVIEAMIENYRLRISILEDIVTYLESKNQDEETNNFEQL